MKKTTAFVFLVSLLICCFGMNSYAADCREGTYSNVGDHDYPYNWADVIKSYLVDCGNDTIMRFQYDDSEGKLLAEYYTYGYKLKDYKEIKEELPLFGGFYASDNYYFILTGKKNPDESADVECFRITKYDKSWKRISSAGLYDCNTTVPFDAGSARFAECGDYLIIRTAHEMYKSSDGYNHQANVTIELNMNTMQITDSFTDIANKAYGYVSHSFNQFVEVENNKIVAVDHGDAYPRSVCLIQYPTDASDGTFSLGWITADSCSCTDMLPFYGRIGANYTGASVGGFEISSSAYLVVGASAEQNESISYKSVRNVYVASLSKATNEVKLTYITDYNDVSAGTPYLVKLSADEFVLIWEKTGTVYYTRLDASGNVTGKTYSIEGALSDCEPIVVNGKLVWYVCDENSIDFYSINSQKLSEAKKTTELTGHDYKVFSVDDDCIGFSCKKCGKKKYGYISDTYILSTVAFSGNGYELDYMEGESEARVGDELYLYGQVEKYGNVDIFETVLKASDSSVARLEEVYAFNQSFYKVTFLKEGKVELTFSSPYTDKYQSVYSVTVGHSYDKEVVTKKPTCVSKGSKTITCTSCGQTKTVELAALGHKFKDNNCKAQSCTVCGEYFAEAHTYKTTVTKATLTENGRVKTVCTVCGNVKTDKTVYAPKTFSLSSTSYTYNGKVKTPTVTVKDSAGSTLKKDVDYTVNYASGRKNAGLYSVTVTMMGNYEGTKTLEFRINPIDISKCSIEVPTGNYTYNGKVRTPSVTVKDANGKKLKEGVDYSVVRSLDRRNVGTYWTIVNMQGNYTGSEGYMFNIRPLDASKCTVKLSSASYTYNGKVKTPTVTVKDTAGNTLKKDVDYTVSYPKGRKLPGKYAVEVTLKGNYSGTRTLYFTIKPIAPTGIKATQTSNTIKLTWNKASGATGYRVYMYNDSTKKWVNQKTLTGTSLTIKKLKANTSYKLKLIAYKKVGNTVIWGDYSPVVKATTKLAAPSKIKIAQNESAIKLTWSKVSGATGYRVYMYNASTKKWVNQKTLTTTSLTVKKLKAGTTYQFKLVAYKKAGNTVVWGDYTAGFKASTRTVAPKITAVASTAKKRAAVSWSNVAGETGYELWASTKKDSGYKKVVTTKADVTKGVRTDLTSGKTYYFKVRAYRTVGNTVVYSAWSAVRVIKIK